MKEVEIIPLAKKRLRNAVFLKHGSAKRYEMRIKPSKDTAVVRLRNSAV